MTPQGRGFFVAATWAKLHPTMTDPLFARYGKEFGLGEVLFQEGEPGEVMYVIQTGAVRISKQVGSEQRTLAKLGPGEFIGEMAILNGKPRTATATVIEAPMRCLAIDAQTLATMVTKNAEIAMRLIKKLAKRLDSADALVEILMQRDPKARVLLALSRHAEATGADPQTEEIVVRTSPAEVAEEVGVETPVAEELFARLRRLKLIRQESEAAVVVTDLGRLRDFIEFLEEPGRGSASSPPSAN
jgi:CRP/FNR family transcriptional regulator, cyclic AMP receptor protein